MNHDEIKKYEKISMLRIPVVPRHNLELFGSCGGFETLLFTMSDLVIIIVFHFEMFVVRWRAQLLHTGRLRRGGFGRDDFRSNENAQHQ